MEKFGAAQPVAQRVFHQTAQRTGTPGQGSLLDGRSGVRADVRGELVPETSSRIPAQVPAEDGGSDGRRRRRRRRLPILAIPPTPPSSPPSSELATTLFACSTTPTIASHATATRAATTAATAAAAPATGGSATVTATAVSAVLPARPIRLQRRRGIPTTRLRRRRILPERLAVGPLRRELLARTKGRQLHRKWRRRRRRRPRQLPRTVRLRLPVQRDFCAHG